MSVPINMCWIVIVQRTSFILRLGALEKGAEPDSKFRYSRAPLSWTAINGVKADRI